MAPSLRRRYLVCFYCNKKSGIKYDGVITQWDCALCESTNFLDENGDITDPPVATEQEARNRLQYTIPRSESALQGSESSLFCQTCLKNQHLYNASLSQYHVELDPSHEKYRDSEKKYYNFRKDLEKRYPQVCEECHPRVLERMKEAGMTAKADYLRRLMDKSRARRFQHESDFSLYGLILFLGRLFWLLGLAGQLFWDILGLVALRPFTSPECFQALGLQKYLGLLELIKSNATAATLVRGGLICSLASLWWNPMFKQMNRGFMNHIKGFGDWYKLQAILILARIIFLSAIGVGVLEDPSSPATRGAHIFMLGFVIMVVRSSRKSLKVDMTPLWATTPEKLPHVGPRSQGTEQPRQSMADALDQIAAAPSRAQQPGSPLSPSVYDNSLGTSLSPVPYPRTRKSLGSPLQSNRAFQPEIQAESVQFLSLEDRSTRLIPQQGLAEEMEWSPTQQPASKHRAFNPARSVQRDNQLFGQAPITEQPSPFWFKVPSAPITPAQQLRNPPNQPRLRVSSVEAKENFFNGVTRREAMQSSGAPASTRPRHEVDFVQPKFFPPPPSNEPGNNLVDLLDSFSLQDEETPKISEQSTRLEHAGQGLVLLLALIFWNQASQHPIGTIQNMKWIIMSACGVIGLRTILINTVLLDRHRNKDLAVGVGACVGSFELAAAGYGILEMVAGKGDCGNCHSLGTILVGGMLVYEIWLAAFGC